MLPVNFAISHLLEFFLSPQDQHFSYLLVVGQLLAVLVLLAVLLLLGLAQTRMDTEVVMIFAQVLLLLVVAVALEYLVLSAPCMALVLVVELVLLLLVFGIPDQRKEELLVLPLKPVVFALLVMETVGSHCSLLQLFVVMLQPFYLLHLQF
jgi:hypothetical protein